MGSRVRCRSATRYVDLKIKKKQLRRIKSFIIDRTQNKKCFLAQTELSEHEIISRLRSIHPKKKLEAIRSLNSKASTQEKHFFRIITKYSLLEDIGNLLKPGTQKELLYGACNVVKTFTKLSPITGRTNFIVPLLFSLFKTKDFYILEQVLVCLGNIALFSNASRNTLIQLGIITEIINIITCETPATLLRQSTKTLSFIVSSDSLLPQNIYDEVIPILKQLIHSMDEDVLHYICIILYYFTDIANNQVQEVIEAGIIPKIAELLDNFNINVAKYALFTLYNIVSGTLSQAKNVLDCNILHSIRRMIEGSPLQKDAIDFVSNLLYGSEYHVQKVLDAGLVEPLLALATYNDYERRMQAILTLKCLNVASSPDQIIQVVKKGVLKRFCSFLSFADVNMQLLALESIKGFFEAAKEQYNFLSQHVKMEGGVRRLQGLASSRVARIREMALCILENYFPTEHTWYPRNHDTREHYAS